MFLNDENEKWVLDYLASGKGMIPYQKIADFDSLNIHPDSNEEFFKHEDFYSTLKEKNISKEEYENVKKFFRLLRLKTLGDMNKIYNFQDTTVFVKFLIKEHRFYNNFLNIILENAIAQVFFLAVFKD